MTVFPDELARLPCRGAFEAHLTVAADTPARRDELVRLCEALGIGCVLIELARGAHPSQPMTSSHHTGALRDVLGEVATLHARLGAAGFPVIRVKLECDPDTEGLPAELPAGYFEFHAKLALPATVDLEALRALCASAGAHLSRNARDRDRDGASTRFVTLRVHGGPRPRAEAAFAALIDRLAAAGHRAAATKAEYTLYDGRLELDAGWLEPA